jgi:uncharacterized protein (DUF305 family)
MFFEGLMLVLFSLFKLLDLQAFKEGFATYDIITKKLPMWGYAFPFVELALGVLVLLNIAIIPVASVLIFLSLIGLVSVSREMKKGSAVKCACLGTALNVPLTKVTLIENLIMLVIAVVMIVAPTGVHSPTADMAMQQSMRVTSDREFLEGMVPHHQEAVDTAKVIVERGTDPDLVALAEMIISAQMREITQMKTWYQQWYGVEYKDTGTYKAMMRSQQGVSVDKLQLEFTQDMVMHHQHAIGMARKLLSFTTRPELVQLASSIITTQDAEVTILKALIQRLNPNASPLPEVDHSMH